MLFEELKCIENQIEGNEYFDGGVAYCIAIDKIDHALPLDCAVHQFLSEVTEEPEINVEITAIKEPKSELRNLCIQWHLDDEITNKILELVDDDTRVYKGCEDYVYVSLGVSEIYRIIEKENERVVIDFYVTD